MFDEVGEFLYQRSQLPFFQKLLAVLLEVENDIGPARRLLAGFDLELALPVGFPAHSIDSPIPLDVKSP